MKKKFDRQNAILQGIIHPEDHSHNRRRLEGFYGKVAREQNAFISRYCVGETILDVGAGYGNLCRELLRMGKHVEAIEVDEEKIQKAWEWMGVRLTFCSLYEWENSVDTVIFREAINHLDLGPAFSQAFRLAKRRCLVFQGSEIFPLRIAKKIYDHHEYDQKSLAQILSGLEKAGFVVRKTIYRDVLAYPLSGGWKGVCWVPSSDRVQDMLLRMDRYLLKIVQNLKIAPYLCFRTLIVAEKPEF